MRDWKREYSMSKSTPSTPTAAKRRNFSQTGNTDGAETGSSGGSGWFGALGGVVGDWLNGWGLLSALRRRSGVGSGMRSMPATPPTNSHPSSPAHEHIELNNLNMECVASGGGGVGVGGGVGGGGSDAKPRHVSVQGGMRRRAQSVHHCPRPSRHSYHEGSHPDSYILTTALIHSLNHRASQPCKEANCRLCAFKVNKVGDRLERPKSLSSRGVGGRFSERSSSSSHGDGEFSNSSSNHLHVTPLNSPTNSLLYAQISPLASPCPTTAASSSSAYPISQSSSNDPTLLSSEVSLTAPESESATLDLSSLTDVTLSSGLLSSSQLSLQMQESASLASGQFHTLSSCSELSPTASSSCTLTESYLDETFTTSATLPASGVSASAYHSAHNSPFRKSGAFESAMTTSAQSLPSRLPNDNKSSVNLTLPRPIVLSTGSLVLLPRRPSLVTSSTLSSASSFGHFMWEENPCYVRMEVVRAGQGHVFRSTTLERPAWCDACAHLVFYHAITCRNCDFTCHEQCQDLVTLDCKTLSQGGGGGGSSSSSSLDDLEDPFSIESPSTPTSPVGRNAHPLGEERSEGEEEEEEEGEEKVEKEAEEEEGEEGDRLEDRPDGAEVLIRVSEASEGSTSEAAGGGAAEEDDNGEDGDTLRDSTLRVKGEKHEGDAQENDQFEETLRVTPRPTMIREVSTLRKSATRLQSHLVGSDQLEEWVAKYNASSQGLQISKEQDGSFRGCIRVHLNLSRPINIVAGTRPPSIYDILQEDRTVEKTLTSFYMPRDAVKAIHVTSKTTTGEVIVALLRKFKVVDNPQKFALYERTYDTAQSAKAKLRRLGDQECPLVLALNWSAQGLSNKRLVLQENDTADIQWEAFTLPELSNFLRILDREEEEYRCQICDKYDLLRKRIQDQLLHIKPQR